MPGGGIPIGAPRPGGMPIGGPIGGLMPGGGPIIPAGAESSGHGEARLGGRPEPPAAAAQAAWRLYLGAELLCPWEAELLVQGGTAWALQRCWRRWPPPPRFLCPEGS